ncbi:hypothetical protein [Ideonella sp. YS5]|uniref:hypothetical protein n=1 Tax=Ideonella sp. YS5 TaxID=3453714 RepID=UPI003EE9DA76
MKQRRLAVLLAILLALLVLRWWVPPEGDVAPEVAAAIVRPVPLAMAPSPVPASADAVAIPDDLSAGTRATDSDDPRNAFAVRMPPPAPAAPAVAAAPAAQPFIEPLPPPPPPPPYQVIGSWRDEQGASVFLAGPRGVLQGRVGDVLGDEYRIAQIEPQQVLLHHLATRREVPLAVPPGSGPSFLIPSK